MTISKSSAEKIDVQEAIEKLRATYEAKVAEGKIKPEPPKPKQLFVPGVGRDDDGHERRAIPNHLARSSLFAAVKRGRRKRYSGEVLVSRSDAKIEYYGQQLDEGDADVWMQVIKTVMGTPLGQPVTVNRAEFLREIGRRRGRATYRWLNESMRRLWDAGIIISVTRPNGQRKIHITEALHLIDGWALNEETNEYEMRLNPRWRQLFAGREYALIDWDKRLAITGRGSELAKALQRLIATSNHLVQSWSLRWLMDWRQYDAAPRQFRAELCRACAELVRVGIIAEWRLEVSTHGQEQLTVELPITVQMDIAPDTIDVTPTDPAISTD